MRTNIILTKDIHVKETFLKFSDEVEKVTSSDVRVTDAI